MNCRLVLSIALLASQTTGPVHGQPPGGKELAPRAPADRLDGPPVLTAKAWAVVDAKTGTVLWGANTTDPRPIASTTKIMTAWIVLRLVEDEPKVLDEVVVVSAKAATTPGSSARIRAGDRIPVKQMLYGLLLPSGNDAAVALAEHFGPRFPAGAPPAGDQPLGRFVAEMNRQAAALKMAGTSYLDPNGLAKNQSTASDLAALARQALQNARFREYVRTRRHQTEIVGGDGEKRSVTWENTNRLLGIEGYDGIKTGTTTAAGSCLVGSGHRGEDHLIVVVLGCPSDDSRYADARNLFRWAWRERGSTQKP